ncbi:MAG TPA: C39 family peptidase [Pelolinea sp.]|nr:C39 family peptidase [Pelolinea sp.]
MRYRHFFFLLLSLIISSCLSGVPGIENAQGKVSDEIVAELVAKALEAYALQAAQTPQPDWGIDAPGEQHSVEVIQAVTPVMEENTELAQDNSSAGEFPDSHYIWNILGHRQFFPIGCEASAADDWAKYFGVEVNEFAFQVRLPLSDNPDLGFVGDVNGPWGQVPPYAYGVHAGPVAQVLRDHYGMNAVGVKGFTLSELKEQIAAEKPVIAWVIGNSTWSKPYAYTDNAGNKVITAPYEHVVIVTGYNELTIRYMNNGKFYDIPTEYFERSWAVLGNMVIYLDE